MVELLVNGLDCSCKYHNQMLLSFAINFSNLQKTNQWNTWK